jgi:acetolactate synthase-1/2/3 large subunit
MRVSEIADLLLKAKRPLIHIGQGARHAEKEFRQLIERLSLPYVTARNANDMGYAKDPLYIGRPGTFAQRGANFAVQLCDLYLAIGTRLSLTQTGYNSKDYARNARIIQVNIDQAELDKGTLRDPVSIRADSREFLAELLKHIDRTPDWSVWLKRCQYLRDKYPVCLPEYEKEKDYVNSFYLIDTLSTLATPEDIIVTDMGFAFQNTHQAWKVKQGQRLFTNCGLAPMGWGLPAAIGAATGTLKRILLITGDGGLMMNIQELATAAHHNLNLKIFLLDNGGYLTIKQTQQLGFEGRLMGVNKETGLSFPHWATVMAGFGIGWEFLNNNHRNHYGNPFKDGLRSILRTKGPYVTICRMNPDQPQAPRSVNRRNPDGTMNPTKLEDAFPFLDPAEVEEMMRL